MGRLILEIADGLLESALVGLTEIMAFYLLHRLVRKGWFAHQCFSHTRPHELAHSHRLVADDASSALLPWFVTCLVHRMTGSPSHSESVIINKECITSFRTQYAINDKAGGYLSRVPSLSTQEKRKGFMKSER